MPKKCPRCRKTYDEGVQFCPDDGGALSAGHLLDPAITAALASDYRILDCLGSGGMGTVFLAEQIRVGNRKVALKVLHRKFSEDEEFIGRFENEAASTGRINHPNVITIYESKQASDGTLYIAMELVEGESLTEHLRRRGRLSVTDVADIVAQCGKALQAAHRLGIIHRDIKPDNIMLTQDSDGGLQVKILDFGIAKLKDSSGHTVTGSVLGTPAYMSYEQASGLSSDKLDGRSDIYSLGIVAYTMLAGHPPFRADTPVAYITKHLTEAPSPLRSVRADLPGAVETVVMKALEKDRDRRYQTAAEFATAFREAAKAPEAAVATVDTTPTPAPPWRARPSVAQTTEVGVGATPTVPTMPPKAPTTPPRPPGHEVPTLPLATPAPPPSRPVAPAPGPPRPMEPVRPSPTGPRVPISDTPPGPSRQPAPPPIERVPTPAVAKAPTRRSAPVRERPEPKVAAPQATGEGTAAILWGARTLLSWGMAAAALMFLLLFFWPLIGDFLPTSLALTLFFLGQPVTQMFPPVRVGGWDPVPLVLGVGLLVLRRYLNGRLRRLEMATRARAVSRGLPG
ncbi:MAG TPA: protein kinase [Methylomirabilota bacterium]|nr:protein kinase [Methylomirabilota bacterium]